jgi:hypothetical protein
MRGGYWRHCTIRSVAESRRDANRHERSHDPVSKRALPDQPCLDSGRRERPVEACGSAARTAPSLYLTRAAISISASVRRKPVPTIRATAVFQAPSRGTQPRGGRSKWMQALNLSRTKNTSDRLPKSNLRLAPNTWSVTVLTTAKKIARLHIQKNERLRSANVRCYRVLERQAFA